MPLTNSCREKTSFCLLAPFILLFCLTGCGGDYPPLDVVGSVELSKYLGKWYEIGSIPVRQQKGCACTTAEYSLDEDGDIAVVNSCRKGEETSRAEGTAFIVPGSNNAKLRVQFFWPFRGDYWILDLADDYSYAVVGTPSREYCWILSRNPSMPEDTFAVLTARLKQRGFDVSKLQRTTHDCE